MLNNFADFIDCFFPVRILGVVQIVDVLQELCRNILKHRFKNLSIRYNYEKLNVTELTKTVLAGSIKGA